LGPRRCNGGAGFLLAAETSRKSSGRESEKDSHSPVTRRGCRESLSLEENAKPRNSKARQWRAVMPVETGEFRIRSRNEFPQNQALSQAEKTSFPQRVVLRRFPPFPGGLLCNQQGENHARSRYEPSSQIF
jgi:hypothetical protein